MTGSQTRLRLRVAVKAMMIVAAFAVLYVFGAAFFSPERRESSLDAMSVGVSQLEPGDTIKVNWDGRPILIHRRTEDEIQWLSQPQGGLSDAASTRSNQPVWAKTAYRSKTPEWFVALAVREDKACTLEEDGERREGGYISSCDGVRFDSAGRVYAGQTDLPINNLRVPVYDVEEELILLGAQSRR